MIRTRLVSLASLTAAVAACSAGAEPPLPEAAGAVAEHLYGPTTFWQCEGYQSLLGDAMNIGRFVAETPEFAACVTGLYHRCSEDGYPVDNPDAVLIASVRDNGTFLWCQDLPGTEEGETGGGEIHELDFGGTEEFGIDAPQFLAGEKAKYGANRGPAFHVAGVIWHEAMHVYGFEHGDHGDPAAARSDCGRDGYVVDAAGDLWDYRDNSANGAVAGCMIGAWSNRGAYVRETANMPMTDTRSSIVDMYYARYHNRLGDAERAAVFARIAAGGYSPSQLAEDARKNATLGDALPIAVGAVTRDELADPLSQRWYRLDLPQKTDLHVTVRAVADDATTPTPGAVGAAPVDLQMIPWVAGAPSGVLLASDYDAAANVTTWQLTAGTWYLRLGSSTGLVQYTLEADEVALAPTGCTATISCGASIEFACGGTPLVALYTQHQDATGAWVGRDALSSVIYEDPSTGAVLPYYRVCEPTTLSVGATCTGAFDYATMPASCDFGGSSSGGSGASGGKTACKGKTCWTG